MKRQIENQKSKTENFDWYTEEDERWDEPDQETAAPRPPGRRWGAILLALLAVTLTGYLLYYLVARQVDHAETTVSQDVLASHDLVGTAVDRGDPELLNLLLSGRDPAWTEAQRALVQLGGAHNLLALGLQPAPDPVAAPEVIMAPNLAEAQVITERPYRVQLGHGVSETIVLRQTAVYRSGVDQRWLLAPPGNAYWGDWQQSQGRALTFFYPERDAEVVQRLVLDLEGKLAEMCRSLPDLPCSRLHSMTISFEKDPAALVHLNNMPAILSTRGQLRLPAPSLVGAPVDEAGYRALFRGYAAYLLPLLSPWECCRGGLFYQAIMERQLSRFALRPWPLTGADYERIYRDPIQLDDLAHLWSEPPQAALSLEEQWALYAFVEFLEQVAPHHPLGRMQQEISASPNFWAWLRRFSEGQLSQPALEQAWLNFVYERAGANPAAADWPQQDLLLLCRRPPGQALVRYRPDSGQWTEELAGPTFDRLHILPPGEVALLSERYPHETGQKVRLSLWSHGRRQVLQEWEYVYDFLFLPAPAGRSGLLLNLLSADGHDKPPALQHIFVDQSTCHLADCPLTYFIETGSSLYTLLSPDGRYTLSDWQYSPAGPQQLLRQAVGSHDPLAVGPGYSPFWLDNETYGYIQPGIDDNRELQLVIAAIADDQPRPLLTWAEIAAVLPPPDNSPELTLTTAVAHPARTDLIYLTLVNPPHPDNSVATLLVYDRRQERLASVWRREGVVLAAPEFPPDGRYLLIRGYDLRHNGAFIELVDRANGRAFTLSPATRDLPRLSWSADGRWLLRLGLRLPELLYLPPDEGLAGLSRHLLAHGFNDCAQGGWIKRT